MRATLVCFLLPIVTTGICAAADSPPRLIKELYGVGVVGNCCTHGAGAAAMFNGRGDTRVIAAYEKAPRRADELAETTKRPLAVSYDAVINDPAVDIVAITCDPADKAEMAEKAAAAGKAKAPAKAAKAPAAKKSSKSASA